MVSFTVYRSLNISIVTNSNQLFKSILLVTLFFYFSLSVYRKWYLEPFFRKHRSSTRSCTMCSWLPLLQIQFLNRFPTPLQRNLMVRIIFIGVNTMSQWSNHTSYSDLLLIMSFYLVISPRMITLLIESTLSMKPTRFKTKYSLFGYHLPFRSPCCREFLFPIIRIKFGTKFMNTSTFTPNSVRDNFVMPCM